MAATATPANGTTPANVPTAAGGTAGVLLPAQFNAAQAYMVPDPSLIMTRGKVIPCTVMPAIDTTLTGIVTCVTGEDATGADGKVSLMDRGTLCVGQQGGGVSFGQRRVGIIWQRCETPQHVLVPLDSGAADALGRPGIPGKVDNHFWDRFGAAIALSLISDIGPYLTATRQGGGNNNTTIAFPNIMNGPETVMSEVLRSTIDIRPTITAPHATRVLIYLAGDIDFRDVYQLERNR
jgi:type IV secretion system protein VirB10